MKINDFIKKYYSGNRNIAAKSIGVSVYSLNNFIHKEREVIELDSGDWIMLQSSNKKFRKETFEIS